MTTRIEFPLTSGGVVIVETRQDQASGVGPAGRLDQAMEKASVTLRDSLKPVIDAASDIMDAFQAMASKPEEVEIQFGVSLKAGLNAVIANSSADAHLDVTLRWTPHQDAVPEN